MTNIIKRNYMIMKTLRIRNLALTKLETMQTKSKKKASSDTDTESTNEKLDNKRKQKYLRFK
jgi:hypothetical protein